MRILDKRGCLKLKKPGPDEGGEDLILLLIAKNQDVKIVRGWNTRKNYITTTTNSVTSKIVLQCSHLNFC